MNARTTAKLFGQGDDAEFEHGRRLIERLLGDSRDARQIITLGNPREDCMPVLRDGNLSREVQAFALMMHPYSESFPCFSMERRRRVQLFALEHAQLDEDIIREFLREPGLRRYPTALGVLAGRRNCPEFVLKGILRQDLPGVDPIMMKMVEQVLFKNPMVYWELVADVFESQPWKSQFEPIQWLEKFSHAVPEWLERKHPELVGMPLEWVASALFTYEQK